MLTIEPYDAPESAAHGQPAYTLPHSGVQLLVHLVDSLTLREIESRAWTVNPNTDTVMESIWGHIWIDRLVCSETTDTAGYCWCHACGFERYPGHL